MYQWLKFIHLGCVVLSVGGFVLRGAWMLAGSPLLKHRLTRSLPHLVDTVLLGSAVAMTVMIGANPLEVDWLAAKIGGLLAYIVLGAVALKRGSTLRIRAAAFVTALVVFSWIVSVALTKNPAGWLALIA